MRGRRVHKDQCFIFFQNNFIGLLVLPANFVFTRVVSLFSFHQLSLVVSREDYLDKIMDFFQTAQFGHVVV